jgi:hypothetical protein
MDFSKQAAKESVNKTIEALAARGISAELVSSKDEAKEKVLSLIPQGAEVMTMTSITLEQTGIAEEINTSEKYISVRKQLVTMDRKTHNREMQQLGAAPDWAIGSVHAVTENGEVLIASNTGSQLSAYVYGSDHIVWVVGAQKIVKNIDEGMQRINEYIVPKETERAREAYNLPEFNTNVSKLLVVNKEISPGRIHIIFVNETLGF